MSDKPGVANGNDGKGTTRGLGRRLVERVGLQRALGAVRDAVTPAPAPAAPLATPSHAMDWRDPEDWSAWEQPTPPAPSPQAPAPALAKKSRRGSETRARGKAVLVRFSEEEFAEHDERARRIGLTLPSYLRELANASKPETKSRHRPPVERELLAKLLGQYGKIGSNLNQIAHAVNMNEPPGKELDAAIVELRILSGQAMRALGRKP